MPVDKYEESAFSGRPVYLYEFFRESNGVTYYWRYNSSDRDLWYLKVSWKAIPISDDGIRLSSDASATQLNVTMPISESFCEQFRLSGSTPSDTVWLRIRRTHAGQIKELDGNIPWVDGDALIVWIGTVDGINQIDELSAKVVCSMLSASFKRGGLRYGYQKNCPHILYQANTCRLNKDDFKQESTVVTVDGSAINASEFGDHPNGYFDGGFIEFTLNSGMVERRMILSHTGDDIVILGLATQMEVGDTISAFPGCRRTIDVCVNTFNNLDNYGGFPHSPGRNPFDGQPVF